MQKRALHTTRIRENKKKGAREGKTGRRDFKERRWCVVCLFVDNMQYPMLFMSAGNLAPSVTKSSRKA